MEQINRGEYQDYGMGGFRPSRTLVVCQMPLLYNAKHTVQACKGGHRDKQLHA